MVDGRTSRRRAQPRRRPCAGSSQLSRLGQQAEAGAASSLGQIRVAGFWSSKAAVASPKPERLEAADQSTVGGNGRVGPHRRPDARGHAPTSAPAKPAVDARSATPSAARRRFGNRGASCGSLVPWGASPTSCASAATRWRRRACGASGAQRSRDYAKAAEGAEGQGRPRRAHPDRDPARRAGEGQVRKEAPGAFESERSGYCGAQDAFYVGNMKG